MKLLFVFQGLLKTVRLGLSQFPSKKVVVPMPPDVYEEVKRTANKKGLSVNDMVIELAKMAEEK